MPVPRDNVDALFQSAANLLMQQRYREAVPIYRQALARVPTHADGWFNLAFALKRLGDFAAALEAYSRALACRPAYAEEIHLNRAVIYSDHLRDESAAERELHAALALAPMHGAAWLNLGNLYEEQGKREPARECYLKLLQVVPTAGRADALRLEAWARLAALSTPEQLDDTLLRSLHAAADDGHEDPGLDPARASLYIALGRHYDRIGDVDRAMDAFARGKQIAHRSSPAYQPEVEVQLIDQLIAAPAAHREAPCSDDADAPAPLFICGLFRSGSTLIEQVLSGHPMIAAAGELDLLPRMVRDQLSPYPQSLARLSAADARRLAQQYGQQRPAALTASAVGLRYVTDKRPDNYRLIGLIKRLFPSAKIIHTQRHLLDNGLSIYMQHLNPRRFGYAATLSSIGHQIGQYRRLMDHWRQCYPGDIYDFSYDAFVRDPGPQLAAVLRFLQLPDHPPCLAFNERSTSVKTASVWQVRRPLYAEASGRWQRYQAHLQPLIDALPADTPLA